MAKAILSAPGIMGQAAVTAKGPRIMAVPVQAVAIRAAMAMAGGRDIDPMKALGAA